VTSLGVGCACAVAAFIILHFVATLFSNANRESPSSQRSKEANYGGCDHILPFKLLSSTSLLQQLPQDEPEARTPTSLRNENHLQFALQQPPSERFGMDTFFCKGSQS